MNEHPILFSGDMVRAILEGRKTQTRRIVKPQPDNPKGPNFDGLWSDTHDPVTRCFGCAYGPVGDQLWVKETHQYTDGALNVQPGWVYRATDPDWETVIGWKWKSSIFMPRKASRITLEIKSVRVERLREISMSDVLAEGCMLSTSKTNPLDYQNLWESINGPGSWDKNPWVWVIEFERVKSHGAEVIAA